MEFGKLLMETKDKLRKDDNMTWALLYEEGFKVLDKNGIKKEIPYAMVHSAAPLGSVKIKVTFRDENSPELIVGPLWNNEQAASTIQRQSNKALSQGDLVLQRQQIAKAQEERKKLLGYEWSGYGGKNKWMDVYPDRVVITSAPGNLSFFDSKGLSGTKIIYFQDVIGLQYKMSGLMVGFVQLETATGMDASGDSNYSSENSFTWQDATLSNKEMREVIQYIEKQWGKIKKQQLHPYSKADEIKKLKSLFDEDVITLEEYEKMKNELVI